ncbi:Transglutaminase-like enzyme, putative cysteine protease [Loktanella fryxellensis]|uniref:Transglutaminase-like enzyme, putative cysteine protease n=1 Tax=Loktanella fryxellensis TaxID=245187 RepID=A0A1H8CNS5_9RHOB|nr:transglutaminase family protein [Loktanella fryxellensis]SEM95938.1 Transglutaminase-like enzyme, putative cysteine protease [Loktanella fryxellensis]
MDSQITVRLNYGVPQPCTVLLQIRAMTDAFQVVTWENTEIAAYKSFRDMPAEEGIGNRIWLETNGDLILTYSAQITVNRPVARMKYLSETPLYQLNAPTVKYLMPSRYCTADGFTEFLQETFGHLAGGRKVKAMAQWITDNLTYDNDSSDGDTTAQDTFDARRGVCRDFAHLLIAFCRSCAIPARIVSVYSPDVTPPDFHAVTEVYLNGGWHLIDPTGMTTPDRMIVVGVGRDAADVAFLTAFGSAMLNEQTVSVTAE